MLKTIFLNKCFTFIDKWLEGELTCDLWAEALGEKTSKMRTIIGIIESRQVVCIKLQQQKMLASFVF